MTTMKLIAKNLCKNYDGATALCGLSFEAAGGDFVNVMGQSGCGKTTLLKCLAGVEPLTSGELYCDDEVLNNVAVQQRNVALVSQEFSLFPNMTVFENVLFALKKQRGTYDEKCAVVWEILRKTGLEDIQNAFPKELSYGQRQKTAIARALVRRPEIMLFDEPLSNVDVESKAVYKSLILQTRQAYPDSIFLYVTHNAVDAMALGNKTLVMSGGRALQFGNTEDVFSSPRTLEVAQICSENCNVRQGVVCDGFVRTDEDEVPLSAYMQATLCAEVGQDVTVAGSGNRVALFDVDGNAVCGQIYEVRIPCCIGKSAVTIDGKSFALGELTDGVVQIGDGFAVCMADKIMAGFDVDAEIPADRLAFAASVIYADEKRVVCRCFDRKITIRIENFDDFPPEKAVVGAKVALSVNIADVHFVTDKGNIAIADYRVYPDVADARVLNAAKGIVSVGGTKLMLPFALPCDKTVQLAFESDCFAITSDKKQLAVRRVLNVQYGATKTVVFAEVHGFDRYVTAVLDNPFAVSKRLFLTADPTKIKIAKQ